MQCSTEEVVIEDFEECLKIKRLYWTVKKICESNLPDINGPGLDSIEVGSAVFVRQTIFEKPEGAVGRVVGKVQLYRMRSGSHPLCIADRG